jgi:serine phosphatase RsbU (regulator of sigma subunit)/anti-sigma regulatory factor (Ser/Thr protein kinase)
VRGSRDDEGLLAALVDTAPVGVAVLGADLRIKRVNATLARMDGVAADDHLGRTIAQVLPDLPPEASTIPRDVLRTGRPVIGVELVGRTPADPDADHVWRVSCYRLDSDGRTLGVGILVVDVTAQRGAEGERAARALQMSLLARASQLLSSSLDPAVTVEHLCDLLVPSLADHVFVDLVHEGARLRRTGIRHAPALVVDPALVRPVGELSRYAADHPIARAVANGTTMRISDLSVAELPDTEDLLFLRRVGVGSVLIVPMQVAGRAVGVATLCQSISGRRYEEEDATLVQQLVSRAAVAVAHAGAYERSRRAAEELQRHLLPRDLGDVEGVDVAWRYVPGSYDTEVGGDWVDVIELSAGRVALVIGDVMGRGLRAAAVMGQLRTAVRVLAQQDLPPADVLGRLDVVVAGLDGGQLVTCVYAVYDPGHAELVVANAGHPPPVLLSDGRAATVVADVNTPLGVGGETFRSTTVPMPPGTVIGLYTDGVIEVPGSDLDAGIAQIGLAMLAGGSDIEEMCDRMLLDVLPGRQALEDDAAVLVVRADAAGLPSPVQSWFGNETESVGRARAALVKALVGWGIPHEDELVGVAELLVSELVTNAVRYTTGPIGVLIRRGRRSITVEVSDSDTRLPRLRRGDVLDEGGRGLTLVQMLSARWGSRPTERGKVVWFALRAPGDQA